MTDSDVGGAAVLLVGGAAALRGTVMGESGCNNVMFGVCGGDRYGSGRRKSIRTYVPGVAVINFGPPNAQSYIA